MKKAEKTGVPLNNSLSFIPFIDYLRNAYKRERGLKQRYIKETINQFDEQHADLQNDHWSGASPVGALFDLTDQALSYRLDNNESSFNIYTMPGWDKVIFIKEALPGMLEIPAERTSFIACIKEQLLGKKELLTTLCYRTIWGHYVEFPCLLPAKSILRYQSVSTGQLYYFQFDADFTFIETQQASTLTSCQQTIEEIDAISLSEEETLQQLFEKLPLHQFGFNGFGKFTVTDITISHIVKLIDRQIDSADHYAKSLTYLNEVHEALKVVAENNQLKFGLLPIFELNGKFLFSEHFSNWETGNRENNSSQNLFDYLINVYRLKPVRIYLKEIADDLAEKYEYLKNHRSNGIRSFALLPIFYHGRFVGVLEVTAKNERELSKLTLSKLETFFPVLSAIFNKGIENLQQNIEQVIKTKFTSLQPSVQWRFNQNAWQYLQDALVQPGAVEIEDIEFNEVYPLYGAIDIKNSTVNRNLALRQDSVFHLQLLRETLYQLKDCTSFGLLEEKIAECLKWQVLVNDESRELQEAELNYFFENDIYCFLKELVSGKPAAAVLTENYFAALNDAYGQSTARRRMLENSMGTVIRAISDLVDNLNSQAQKDFPCFFEKFRTDGVEYDIYVGQSITPDLPFNHIFIKNLRLMQLSNMIAIGTRIHQLQTQLEVPVEITQLIFVNPNFIDIRFRRDERRFDVEGAYNIRYHIVKKRIDKVLIKNTAQRLTVPGKIAIVYTNQKEAEEYLVHIHFLQKQSLIMDEIEVVELEQLQGVIGLKAMRLTIRYPNDLNANL